MNRNEFQEILKKEVEDKLGAMYEVHITNVLKNNGVHKAAFMISRESSVAMTMYLEEAWTGYLAGKDISLLATEMVNAVKEQSISSESVEPIFDFHKIKNQIGIKLMNMEKNRDMLERLPYRSWEDLAIVFYINTSDALGVPSTVMISYGLLGKWGISETELVNTAFQNAPRNFPYVLIDLNEMVNGMCGNNLAEEGIRNLYVLSNKDFHFGASVIAYESTLKTVGEKLNMKRFYILPSSIHEVILVSKEDGEVEQLSELVHGVNQEMVSPEEFLSDHVYEVDLEQETVKIAL